MILKWDSPKVPFQYQKLGFTTEKSLFKYAYEEANSLRELIVRVGNHKKKHCQIIAVSREKALKEQESVLARYVENHRASIMQVIKDAKKINGKTTKAKSTPKPKTINLRG